MGGLQMKSASSGYPVSAGCYPVCSIRRWTSHCMTIGEVLPSRASIPARRHVQRRGAIKSFPRYSPACQGKEQGKRKAPHPQAHQVAPALPVRAFLRPPKYKRLTLLLRCVSIHPWRFNPSSAARRKTFSICIACAAGRISKWLPCANCACSTPPLFCWT